MVKTTRIEQKISISKEDKNLPLENIRKIETTALNEKKLIKIILNETP
jgi:hypothetical protein